MEEDITATERRFRLVTPRSRPTVREISPDVMDSDSDFSMSSISSDITLRDSDSRPTSATASTIPTLTTPSRSSSNEDEGLVSSEDSNGAAPTLSLPSVDERTESSSDRSECEPPAKIRKLESPGRDNDNEDADTCPICFDAWANTGDHRLVSLKCGHLFGARCVERWLKGQAAKDKTCPTCKSKANIRDLRPIYAKKLTAADASQITALQGQVNKLEVEKSRLEHELESALLKNHSTNLELKLLKTKMRMGSAAVETKKYWRFALEKNVEVTKDASCRVLTYNCRTYEMYVSQKSLNTLFPGFGIRKVSCVDYKLGQFIHLHPKPIRDMTYSTQRDLLLSVSFDGGAKIVERGVPVMAINTGVPLWSCAWDVTKKSDFYVGAVGGAVQLYDLRNTSASVSRLTSPNDMSPVVSMCSTEFGLLFGQLNSCGLTPIGPWEDSTSVLTLPVDGPFLSLAYDHESQWALVNSRPVAQRSGERSKLSILKLSKVIGGDVKFQKIKSFSGSTRSSLLSRSTFVKTPDTTWPAAHSESDNTLFLYGLGGAETISLPSADPALDVCSALVNGDLIVASLSASRLRMYRAEYKSNH